MEKKNQRNPFISGGVLVNDSDYFEKDEVNMSNDSLKASLELVNKIRQQKKAEMDNATYLKETIVSSETNNISSAKQFDVPKDVAKIKTSTPVYKAKESEVVNNPFDFNSINQNTNPSSPGISLADLDKDNQKNLTEKKDEYLPDYRNEGPQFTSPLQNNNYSDMYSPDNFQQNNPQPVYVEEASNPEAQFPQEFNFDGQEHASDEKPKYKVSDKETGVKNPKYPQSTSTREDIKAGKGVAWLAYILFFIPLLLNGKNPFVRWHVNEGLELNLLDLLGGGLLVAGWLLKSENIIVSTVFLIMVAVGAIIVALTTFTKLIMIIFCLSGKEARNPWGLRRFRIIK